MKQILNSHYFLSESNEVVNSKNGNILKWSKMGKSNKYLNMSLSIDGKRLSVSLHRLIAHLHLGLNLRDSKTQVDHIDNDSSNNSLDNLRLCSNLENQNFHSKHQLPHYISKRGVNYIYNRTVNGKRKNLKSSINLDVILEFKRNYETV